MPSHAEYQRLANEGGRHAHLFAGMAKWCEEQEIPLTGVEHLIALKLAEGMRRTDIAVSLSCSDVWVAKQVGRIWQKLDMPRTSDAGLVFQMAKRGWL